MPQNIKDIKSLKQFSEIYMKKLHYMNVKKLYEHCEPDCVFFYIYTNILRAPLEAAVTLYVAEALVIFTTFYNNEIDPKAIVLAIFIPLIASAVICILYSIYASRKVYKWVCDVIDYKDKKDTITYYLKIDAEFIEMMKGVHIFGAVFYTICSSAAITFLVLKGIVESPFNNTLKIISMSCFGLLYGALWNIYGFYSDSRIDWSTIFKFFKETRLKNIHELRVYKYCSFRRSVLSQITILCFTIIFTFLIISNIIFSGGILLDISSVADLLSYATFIAFFFFYICFLYQANVFSFLYTQSQGLCNIYLYR